MNYSGPVPSQLLPGKVLWEGGCAISLRDRQKLRCQGGRNGCTLKTFHVLTCQCCMCCSVALHLGNQGLFFKEQEISPPSTPINKYNTLHTRGSMAPVGSDLVRSRIKIVNMMVEQQRAFGGQKPHSALVFSQPRRTLLSVYSEWYSL